MFTRFMDMHSGGSAKEEWEYIYIEAPEDEATTIFYNRFGHNPNRVTCTCCGQDYSIGDSETLEEATRYNRQNIWNKNGKLPEITVEEYAQREEVLIIYENEIKEEERNGDVPTQGYVYI